MSEQQREARVSQSGVTTGTLARVAAVDDHGTVIRLRLLDGRIGTATNSDGWDQSVGDVVLVGDDGLEAVSAELWPHPDRVGVVKIKSHHGAVVSAGASFQLLPRPGADCEVGNTVLFDDALGVTSVVQEHPVGWLDNDDPAVALRRYRHEPEETTESFESIGGLGDVLARARELIELPVRRGGQLARIGARPVKGVLFAGPPGTGKTMLARVIAARSDAVFYEIRGPEIFSKWLGDSEQVLRLIFEDAEKNDRSIIFFDEIDSVAAIRDGDSHEASRRVVAQLLTLMDGFTASSNIVVIAATNRVDQIDPAILRPGRFDWRIDFPLPDVAGRLQILDRHSQRLRTAGPLPHALVAHDTNGWSGADLALIYSEAALVAASDEGDSITPEDYLAGYERVRARRDRAASEDRGAK